MGSKYKYIKIDGSINAPRLIMRMPDHKVSNGNQLNNNNLNNNQTNNKMGKGYCRIRKR